MSKSAKSVFLFSLYLFMLGVILLLFPNLLLKLFFIAPTSEVWIRVVGMLAFVLGLYYFQAAMSDLKQFFQWTVYVRASVLFFFIGLVLFADAPPVLVLFGLIDAAAGLWTHYSLINDTEKTSASENA
jgi:hypothetical protein